jgi:chromosome segregation ATPase
MRLIEDSNFVERLCPPAQVKTVEMYAQEIEAVYTEVCDDTSRAPRLRQRLVAQYQQMSVLRQESDWLHAERDALQAQVRVLQEQHSRMAAAKTTIEEARDQAVQQVAALSELVRVCESQAQEREERLNTIYDSTTWKLYRCYVVLEQQLFRRPLRILKRIGKCLQ